MIPFNRPCHLGAETGYIAEAIAARRLSGDGSFTKKCSELLEAKTGAARVLLTTSCSHALDLAALLLDLEPGDEVIMPSYTFVSTANAFVLRGAKAVFVDIRPDTLNMDETAIEAAITPRTKAIAPVHYAGVSCEMDAMLEIATRHGLAVVEDAAQGVHSRYKGRALGTMGDFGAFSFHESKNYTCGEGGALLIRDPSKAERAEIMREKGTDRAKFFRGQVDKYTWVDIGSSYLPSELNAAYLFAQLKAFDTINDARMQIWKRYFQGFADLALSEAVVLPAIPAHCEHNAHMFYLKVRDLRTRSRLIEHLKANGIMAVFHYIPLHSSPAGMRFGRFNGEDKYTTRESERLLRLPLFYGLTGHEVDGIIACVEDFFRN